MTELEKIIAAQECLSNTVMHPCSSCDFAGRKETCVVECAKATLKLLRGMEQVSFEGSFLCRDDFVNVGDIMIACPKSRSPMRQHFMLLP